MAINSPFGENSVFDPSFEWLADESKDKSKLLAIAYDSVEYNVNVGFSLLNLMYINCKVTSENLETTNATVELIPYNIYGTKPSQKIIVPGNILKSGSTLIKIEIDKEAVNSMGMLFKAKITCDGISSTSGVFGIDGTAEDRNPITETPSSKCFCKNQDLGPNDLKYIVTRLRKMDTRPISRIPPDSKGNRTYIDKNGKVIPSTDRGKRPTNAVRVNTEIIQLSVFDDKDDDEGKPFADRLFMNKARGLNIKKEEANYGELSKQLNWIFRKYEINTCLRKLHFIAQTYHEAQKYRSTYENISGSGYSGGDFYQGRGLKQITHDYNYLEYFCHQTEDSAQKKLFELYIKHRTGKRESVVKFNERTANQYISVEDMKQVNDIASKISTDMYYACDAAGWYWWNNKINDYADQDNIIGVSALVNNPSAKDQKTSDGINQFDLRKKYYDLLKIIFDYENCK